MNISGKITKAVDGYNGKLFHFDGKADGEKASLFVQEKAKGIFALALPKDKPSTIGSQRVIAYTGNQVAEAKGVGSTIEFDGVHAPTREMKARGKEDLMQKIAELEKQQEELKAIAELAASKLEEAKK